MLASRAKAMSTPISDPGEIDPQIVEALADLPSDFHGFSRTYQEEIRPALAAREGDRIAAVKTARRSVVIGAIVAVAGVAASLAAFRIPALAFLSGVVGIGIGIWGRQGVSKLKGEAKDLIVAPVVRELSLTFDSTPGQVASISNHREVRLVPDWDRASFEDRVTGSRHGVDFELFEAHLEDRRTTTSNGKTRTRWVTVFRGQCLRFKFHKTFYGRTLVSRDSGFFNRFGGGGGLERAALEDPRFEKVFEVYTTDQVESRFLLTPDLMQRLIELEDVFHGGKLKCCFDKGEMFITIQGGDLFEPGSMFTALDDPSRVRDLLKDFAAIFHVIDEVNAGRKREEIERGG